MSDDAVFSLAVDGGAAVEVTVPKVASESNTTVAGLVANINAALAVKGLAAQVLAERDGNRVMLHRIGDAGSLEILVQNGTPAYTEIGFRNGQSAEMIEGQLLLKAKAEVSGYVGRLSRDATFFISMNTANGGVPVPVIVPKADTDANRNILDVVVDVQKAIDSAKVGNVQVLKDKIEVSSAGRRLLLSAKAPGTNSITVTADGGDPAVTELGFDTSNVGSGADIVITTCDIAPGESGYAVHFDDLPSNATLGDIITAIETQTSGKVDVQLFDGNTRLLLQDQTGGPNSLRIRNGFGSTAASDLGILRPEFRESDLRDEDFPPGTPQHVKDAQRKARASAQEPR